MHSNSRQQWETTTLHSFRKRIPFLLACFLIKTGMDWIGLDWTGLDWIGLKSLRFLLGSRLNLLSFIQRPVGRLALRPLPATDNNLIILTRIVTATALGAHRRGRSTRSRGHRRVQPRRRRRPPHVRSIKGARRGRRRRGEVRLRVEKLRVMIPVVRRHIPHLFQNVMQIVHRQQRRRRPPGLPFLLLLLLIRLLHPRGEPWERRKGWIVIVLQMRQLMQRCFGIRARKVSWKGEPLGSRACKVGR